MRRTNIYLTDGEQMALDARAAAEGTSRSEVIRANVDRELNLGAHDTSALDSVLCQAATEFAERARVSSRQDPDLHIS